MSGYKRALALLLSIAAISGCATPPPAIKPAQIAPAKLAPPPADVMVPRPANFQQRLLDFFSSSPAKPTK